MTINFEQDRVESVTQIDAAKTLSDKVLKLKDLEDEIANAEESINKLKEQARILSQIEIPIMMQQYAVLARGQGFEPVQKVGVHAQTLKAVVRERIESGQDMPSDLFKTFAGNQTKITRR